MRDLIGTDQWINRPLANPTQNIFMRFAKMPLSEPVTAYTKIRDDIEKFNPLKIHTRWDAWWL